MTSVQQLEAALQAMLALKPPGVAKSKIEAITNLCVASFQDESSLVSAIYTHFKKTPNTHKLGVLYVVDSVTRQWIERARQAGQALDQPKNATEGTYAAGVRRMNGLLPIFLNDLFLDLPGGQKDKAAKLLDIWERSHTFPQQDFTTYKQKLGMPNQGSTAAQATPSVPVPTTAPSNGNIPMPFIQAATFQPQAQPVPTLAPSIPTSGNFSATQYPASGFQQPVADPVSQLSQYMPALQNMQAAMPQVAPQVAPSAPAVNAAPVQPATPLGPNVLAALGQIKLETSNPTTLALQIQLVQALSAGKIPIDQIPQVLTALGVSIPTAQTQPNPPVAAPQLNAQAMPLPIVAQNGNPYEAHGQGQQSDHFHGHANGSNDPNRQKRQRSRSPDHKRRRPSPPNRRKSPVYGAYDPSTAVATSSPQPPHDKSENDRRGKKGKGGKGSDLLGRSRPSPPQAPPKLIGFDPDLQANHIRVLSRTLFVGGVTGSEKDLEDIFSRFGGVQSVNAQSDKRHAFVKMYTRVEAERARKGMDKVTDPNVLRLARQTRWGVGFGPRSCCDYETGESVLPIDVLTEADRRWVLEAKYGGTGGRPLATGMVIEEPDIEIGAGVSSKALGKRMEPQGKRGGHQNGGGRGRFDPGAPRFRKPDRQEQQKQENRRNEPRTAEEKAIGVPPPVPGFGFQLPGFPMNY